MWTPAIIALGVLVISFIVQTVLVSKDFIKERSIPSAILTCVGMIIPAMIIAGNYSYLKTDTLMEAVIVFAGICLSLALLGLFSELWSKKKYNFILFPIIVFSGLLILSLITPFMLSHIPWQIYNSIIASNLGSSTSRNPYKGRLIISGIIVIIIVITAPVKLISPVKVQTKVERAVVEYAGGKSHELTKDYRIDIGFGVNRYSPIQVVIFRWNLSNDSTPDNFIYLTYYEGKITERKK